jgi:hypothetical protein
MSEQPGQRQTQGQGEEREWPTHCEHCGRELESGVVDVVPNSDSEHLQTGSPATVIAQDFCPNPDCPGKDIDTAKAVGPDGIL